MLWRELRLITHHVNKFVCCKNFVHLYFNSVFRKPFQRFSMAQKSILSFFSPPKPGKTSEKIHNGDVSSQSEAKKKSSPVQITDEKVELRNSTKESENGKSSPYEEETKYGVPLRKTARKGITPLKSLLNKGKGKKSPEGKQTSTHENLIKNEKEKSPENKKVKSLKSKKEKSPKNEKNKSPQNKKDKSPKNEKQNQTNNKETLIDNKSDTKNAKKTTVTTTDIISKKSKMVKKITSDDEEENDLKNDSIKTSNDETMEENDEDLKIKRKVDDLSENSSDEEIQTVKKKRRGNVITDDSPVKQVASIFQKSKENYKSKLDKFIMKPKEDTKNDSTVISDIVKEDQKELNESVKKDEEKSTQSKEKDSKTLNIKKEEKVSDKEKEEKSSGDVEGEKMEIDDAESKENSTKSETVLKKDASKKNKKPASEIYCPSKHNYHPIDDACWKRGEKVPYLALAKTFEEIENTSGRLKMIEILANFFRSVIVLSPDDLVYSIYLCLNRLAPEYHSVELGVGETLLMKAMGQATGRSIDKIKAEVAIKGDLGLVAESSRANQRVMFGFPKLTISSVFTQFKEIAEMSGNAVMNKKISKMQGLFSACRDCEAKYIIRSLGGKLRIGLAEQSVLAALGQAVTLTPPNQEYPPKVINALCSMREKDAKELMDSQTLIIKTTYCECPNYDAIIPILLKDGVNELPKHCHLTPGIPLKPMLAHPSNSIDEVLKRFDNNEFTCEFKYDGERAQIHRLEDGSVKIYSRNQEDNTTKYPDVIERFSKSLAPETKSCILDSEIVAWDSEAKQIRPFQVLSTRKRKDAVSSEISVQVCVVAFDLLYLNGEALVRKPLAERRELLHKSFQEVANEFSFVQSMDGNTSEVMQNFLDESVKGNCEGLMVKALKVDATYEIAKRSRNWLKLKKDYLEGAGDSLDLLVIGGWFGKGKRTGTYGGFLLACYDTDTEEFQTVCKLGTGFSDSDLETHTSFFKNHTIPKAHPDYRYESGLQPDQWFEPVQVWEVKCSDLSVSPVHKAACGLVDPEKGISLRFPRFIRIRDDKKPEDVTSSEEVANMYNRQKQIQNQNTKDSKDDIEDYY